MICGTVFIPLVTRNRNSWCNPEQSFEASMRENPSANKLSYFNLWMMLAAIADGTICCENFLIIRRTWLGFHVKYIYSELHYVCKLINDILLKPNANIKTFLHYKSVFRSSFFIEPFEVSPCSVTTTKFRTIKYYSLCYMKVPTISQKWHYWWRI